MRVKLSAPAQIDQAKYSDCGGRRSCRGTTVARSMRLEVSLRGATLREDRRTARVCIRDWPMQPKSRGGTLTSEDKAHELASLSSCACGMRGRGMITNLQPHFRVNRLDDEKKPTKLPCSTSSPCCIEVALYRCIHHKAYNGAYSAQPSHTAIHLPRIVTLAW